MVFTYVLREGNKCADYQTNLEQMVIWETKIFEDSPDRMNELLQVDAEEAS